MYAIKKPILGALLLAVFLAGLTGYGSSSLKELWSQVTTKYCGSLSVSDQGVVAVIEQSKTESVLSIYGPKGDLYDRWRPPAGKAFSSCEVWEEYILATFGTTVTLFRNYGREQAWAKAVDSLWADATTLGGESGLIVTANQPFPHSSTVFVMDMGGKLKWSASVPSFATSTAVARDGYVAVGGEKHGALFDKGCHAVYLFSPTGKEKYRYIIDSPVIDVAISHDHAYVLAGLDNGSMLLLNGDGELLWRKEDVGGWVDLAAHALVIVGDRKAHGFEVLDKAGNTLWVTEGYAFGGEDGVRISDDGSIIAVTRFSMIYPDNFVRIYDGGSNVLYEEFCSETLPGVSVSPNGKYAAVAFSYRLRLFEVAD